MNWRRLCRVGRFIGGKPSSSNGVVNRTAVSAGVQPSFVEEPILIRQSEKAGSTRILNERALIMPLC